jgi:hypothetical protein
MTVLGNVPRLTFLQIFDEFKSGAEHENETYALPGGTPCSQHKLRSSDQRQVFPIEELINFELPSKPVMDFLLKTYFDSVHWFMLIVHEPTFRQSYELISRTRQAPRHKMSFLVLLMVLLAMGGKLLSIRSI